MKPQPRLDKKWTIICGLAVLLLVASTYVLTIPLDTKLRFFCTIDGDHIADAPPAYHHLSYLLPQADYIGDRTVHINGYWTNPSTDTILSVITIWEAIDAGTWLYYDIKENIFWIAVQNGPMKNAFYGPYPGMLWATTSLIDPLALAGIILSIIALVCQTIHRLWRKNRTAAREVEGAQQL